MKARTHNLQTDSCSKSINKEKRNSSFELLRIISLFSITICHFATHGGFCFDAQTVSIPRFWWYFIEMGGNFGVDVFVLISGYFLITEKYEVFNFKKILKFWGQVFFYSILIYFVFGAMGIGEFSMEALAKTIFPITFGQWWFASTYFVLYLLHPFLNLFLNKLEKKKFQSLLVLLIVIWCIIPTFTFTAFQSNSLLWFITLYSVSAYIRLYDLNLRFTKKYYSCFWLLFSVLRYLSSIILILIGTKISIAAKHPLAFYGTQSVLTFLSALSLFMVFKNIRMGYHKWINVIASATFGVYLIHDNNLVRPFLWKTVFHNAYFQDSILLIPYSIAVTAIVYILCTVLDLLRQRVIERPYMQLINRNTDKLSTVTKKVSNFFCGILFGNESMSYSE